MTKIVRTPTQATGGITADEAKAMKAHADLWISRAMRTTPVDVDEITSAVHDLYAAAGLKQPRVVVVPSPLVMAFAYGASAAIWWNRKTAIATDNATYNATANATDIATRNATRNATAIATDIATHNATDNATRNATAIATDIATDNATANATRNATANATRNATAEAASACIPNTRPRMTADLFDRLQTIKDRCDAHLEKAAKAAKRLETEMANLETELLLADALSALRLVSTRNMSEGQRSQIAGLKKRITQALEKAA